MKNLVHKLTFITCLAVAPMAFAATETRELPEFSNITSQGVYKLVVNAGQKQSVVLDGGKEFLDKIKTSVSGDRLVISMAETKNQNWKDKVTITINVPQLKEFQSEGVGSTTLSHLAGDRFTLNYQGVGSLTATGSVNKLVLHAQGVGLLDAKGLTAREVQATLEGVGSVDVRATDSLDANVQGVGSLTYYGKPKKVNKSVEGVGRVHAGD